MTWKIVSMEKPAGDAMEYAHNYVALVDDDGRIVKEYHGWYGDHWTLPFLGSDSDNFLIGVETEPNRLFPSIRPNLLTGERAVDILLANGSLMQNRAKVLDRGSQLAMQLKWTNAIAAIESVLADGRFLYQTYNMFSVPTNSNSVWWTFVQLIGGELTPGNYIGNTSPGVQDLRSIESNNPKYLDENQREREAEIYLQQKAQIH